MIDLKDFWKYKGKFFTNKEWDGDVVYYSPEPLSGEISTWLMRKGNE